MHTTTEREKERESEYVRLSAARAVPRFITRVERREETRRMLGVLKSVHCSYIQQKNKTGAGCNNAIITIDTNNYY